MRKLLFFFVFFFFSISTVHADEVQKHNIQTNTIDFNGVSLPPVDNFPDQTICNFVMWKGIYPDATDSYFLYPLVTDATYTTCDSLLSTTGKFLERRGSGNSTYYLIPMSSAGYSANYNSANYGTKILSATISDSEWEYLTGVNEQYFQMLKPTSCGTELFPHILAITDTTWDYYGTTYNWANSTNSYNSGYCSLGTTVTWDDLLFANFSSEPELEYPISSVIAVSDFSIASASSTLTASVSGALSFEDVSDEDFCVYSFYNSQVSSQLNSGSLLAHVIVDNAVIVNGQYTILGGGPKDLSKLDLTAPIYYGIGTTRGWYQNITFPAAYGSPFNLQSSYTCYYSDYDGETLTGYSSSGSTNHTDVTGSPTHEDMQDSYACDPGSNFFSLFLCQQISSFKIWMINQVTIPTQAIDLQLAKLRDVLDEKAPFAYVSAIHSTVFTRTSTSPLDISASDFSVFNFSFLGTEYNITTPAFVTSLFLVVRKTMLIVLFTMFIAYLFSVGRRIYGSNT